jgi:hypothetical protein
MNVLDLRTYKAHPGLSGKSGFDQWTKNDLNSIPAIERYEMAHARGLCLDILRWFFREYEIFEKESDESIDGFTEVAMQYLAHQASVILVCKKKAVDNDVEDGVLCSVKKLDRQMKLCFQDHKLLGNIDLDGDDEDGDDNLSLAFPDVGLYGVRKLEKRRSHKCKGLLQPNLVPH